MKRTIFCVVGVAAVFPGWSPARANGSAGRVEPAAASAAVFDDATFELQALSGVLFSPVVYVQNRRDFHYETNILRVGWMAATSRTAGVFRGGLELLGDVVGAIVFRGFGTGLVGTTFVVRYNFVQPTWRVVPYFQIGAGVVFTDAYKNDSQRMIGQSLEFTPQSSVGARIVMSARWSLTFEFMYHHISNADLAERNVGINALGGMVGASYLFGKALVRDARSPALNAR